MLRDSRQCHDPTSVPVASGVSGMNSALESRARKEEARLQARLAQKLQDDMLRLMKEELFSDLLFTNGKHLVPGHEIIVKSRLRDLLPENCLGPSAGTDKPSLHVQVDTLEELQRFVSTLYTSDKLDDTIILSKLKPANSSVRKDTCSLDQNVNNAQEEDTCEVDILPKKLQRNCADTDPFNTISDGDHRSEGANAHMEGKENGLQFDAVANTNVSSGNSINGSLQNTSPSLENNELLEITDGSLENCSISPKNTSSSPENVSVAGGNAIRLPENTNASNTYTKSESSETSLCKPDTLEREQFQLPVCEADIQCVESLPTASLGSAPGSRESEDTGKDAIQGVALVSNERSLQLSQTEVTVQETGSLTSRERSLPTSFGSTLEGQENKQELYPLMSDEASLQVSVNCNSQVLGSVQETSLSTSSNTSDNFEAQEVVQDISDSTSLAEVKLQTLGNFDGQERESLPKTFSTLGSSLMQFYKSGVDTDCCLVAEGQKFPAHRCILVVRCHYFDAMFNGSWFESSETEIELHGVKARSAEHILQFLYGAMIDVDADDIPSILQTADMFGMEELKQLMAFQITRDFCHFFHKPCQECLQSVQDVLLLASQYNLTELLDRTKQWVASHFRRIWEIQAFGSLPVSLLDLCTDVIIKGMSVSNITQVTLDAHDLLRILQRFRRSAHIQAAAIKVMDAALEYAAEHFPQLVKSKHFLSWSKQGAWCCDVLLETYMMVISLLQPEMAVEVYNSLTQMYANMSLEEEAFQRAIYSGEVMNMMRKLVERCEWYLQRYIHLLVQCPQWASLPKYKQQELLQKSSFVPVQTAGSGFAQSRMVQKSAAAKQQNIAHTVNMLCETDPTIFPYLSAIRASCQTLSRPSAARQPEYGALAPRTTSAARSVKYKTDTAPSHSSTRDIKGTGGMKGTKGAGHPGMSKPSTLKKIVETSRTSDLPRHTASHGASAGPSRNGDSTKVKPSRTLSSGSSKVSGTPKTSSCPDSASGSKVRDGSKASSAFSAKNAAAHNTKVGLNMVSGLSKVLPKGSAGGLKKVPASSQTRASTSTDPSSESFNLLMHAATGTANSAGGCEHKGITTDSSDATNTVMSTAAPIQPEVESANSGPFEVYNAPSATSVIAGKGLPQPSRSTNKAVVGTSFSKERRRSPRNGLALGPGSATGSRSTGTRTDHKKESSVAGPSSRPLSARSGSSAGPSSRPSSARSGTSVESGSGSAKSSECAGASSRPASAWSNASAGASSSSTRSSAGPHLRPDSAQSSASCQKLRSSQASTAAGSKKGSGFSSKVSSTKSPLRPSSARSSGPSHKLQSSQGAVLGTNVKGYPGRKASGSAGKIAAANSSAPPPRPRSTKSGASGLQADGCQVSGSSTREKGPKGAASASTKKGSVLAAASLARPSAVQSERPGPKPQSRPTMSTSSHEKGAACSSQSVKVTLQKDEAGSSKDLPWKDEVDSNKDIPQKGEVDSSKDLPQKDEMDFNEDLPQKDQADSSKDLLQKIDVESSEDLPQKDKVDPSKNLPQKDEMDFHEDISQKNQADSFKDLPQKIEVESSKDLPQKIEMESSKDLMQKIEVESSKDLPQNKLDSSKDLSQNCEVDSSTDIPQKDEVDFHKDLPQRDKVDSSKDLLQKDEMDFPKDSPHEDEVDFRKDLTQKQEMDSMKDLLQKDEADSHEDLPQKDEIDSCNGQAVSSKVLTQRDIRDSCKDLTQKDDMDYIRDLTQKDETDCSKNLSQKDEVYYITDLPQKDEADLSEDLAPKDEADSGKDLPQKDELDPVPQNFEVESSDARPQKDEKIGEGLPQKLVQ